jgi:integrase/recombinase XerD
MKKELNKNNQAVINQYKLVIGTRTVQNKNTVFINPAIEFLTWLEARGVNDITELANDPQLMIDYIEFLNVRPHKRTGNPLAPSTVVKFKYSVSIFLEELVNLKILKSAYYTHKRAKNEYIGRTPFTREEIELLYACCETKLEKMILHLGYSFGMRRGGIKNLTVADINFNKGYLVVRKGKYNKRREIFNPDNVLADLEDYLTTERQDVLVKRGTFHVEEFIVSDRHGTGVHGSFVNRRFKEILKRSGIERDGSLHDLRASIITHLLDAGMPMEKVQEFSGHTLVDTVHIYAMKRKMIDNLKMVA